MRVVTPVTTKALSASDERRVAGTTRADDDARSCHQLKESWQPRELVDLVTGLRSAAIPIRDAGAPAVNSSAQNTEQNTVAMMMIYIMKKNFLAWLASLQTWSLIKASIIILL